LLSWVSGLDGVAHFDRAGSAPPEGAPGAGLSADRAVEWNFAGDLVETERWTPEQLEVRFAADARTLNGNPRWPRLLYDQSLK